MKPKLVFWFCIRYFCSMKHTSDSSMKQLLSILSVCLLLFTVSCERVANERHISLENSDEKNQEQSSKKEKDKDYDYKVRVIRISDGDTFVGKTQDNIEIRYRLYGIDAPEKKQAFSKKATQKLSELIYQTDVEITVKTKSDKYGRPIVIGKSKSGVIVNEELLRLGLAWHYKYFDNTEKYAQLEQRAKEKKLGLWQDENPIPPWDYRRDKKKNSGKR